MPITIPKSRTVALQIALADYLQRETGLFWRDFTDEIQVAKSGALNYSAIVYFVRKGGSTTPTYRVQVRLRCAGNNERIVDETLGDWIDYLDQLLHQCIRINGIYRDRSLNQNIRLAPETEWTIAVKENQDGGAVGTIARQWSFEDDFLHG